MGNSFEDRLYVRMIDGLEIFFTDFRDLGPEEIYQLMEEHVERCVNIKTKDGLPLLIISQFNLTVIDAEFFNEVIKLVMPCAHIRRISIIMGFNDYLKSLLNMVNVNREYPYFSCDTIEEAVSILKENLYKV